MPETNAATKYIQSLSKDLASVAADISTMSAVQKRVWRENDALFIGTVAASTVNKTTATGAWGEIYFLTDATIASITAANLSGIAELSSKSTIPAGVSLRGSITKIKTNLKTGRAILLYEATT